MARSRLARASGIAFRAIPLSLAATLLIVAVAINLANVIGRYAFQAAIYWAEEAMIYMAIWSIFLAAVAIAYDGADLTMGLFSARLSPPWRRIVCSRWLPPIESPSPSPVTTQTESSGRLALMPVANAGARPWIVCMPYVFM